MAEIMIFGLNPSMVLGGRVTRFLLGYILRRGHCWLPNPRICTLDRLKYMGFNRGESPLAGEIS
jgi:hypothetical protein